MRFLFIMDPVQTVLVDKDTSFSFMFESQTRGHEVHHCLVCDVGLEDGHVVARAHRAHMQQNAAAPILLSELRLVPLHEYDAVFIRKDPPFDPEYLWLTLLLELAREQTFILNDPRGLREANEKLYAFRFPELIPKTILSSDKARIREFAKSNGGKAVIKPIGGHGGGSVFAISTSDLNINAAIETVTREGERIAVVQEFLPASRTGDKRILLLEGEPIGAFLRVPQSDDLRSNLHVGGYPEACTITESDQRIVNTLAPSLKRDGLWFVGIDVIGDKLTEVNVTSPTGIQQMSRLTNQNLPARVIDWVEKKASTRRPT